MEWDIKRHYIVTLYKSKQPKYKKEKEMSLGGQLRKGDVLLCFHPTCPKCISKDGICTIGTPKCRDIVKTVKEGIALKEKIEAMA